LAGSRLKTWWEIHGNVQVATDEDVALNLRYPEPRRLAKAQIVERQIDTLNARIKALQEQKSAKEDKLQGLYSEAFHAGQPLTLAEVAEMGRAQMAEVLKVERSKARNKALHRRIEVEE
jgi:regulator of replication initiation timing